jgi:hypothetical protein
MDYVTYFSDNGAPQTGLSPVVDIYKKVGDGNDVTPAPAVTELGGGFYKFSASPSEDRVVRLDGGTGLADADRYKVLLISPQDDVLTVIKALSLADGESLNSDSWLSLLRQLKWLLRNKLVINRNTGAYTAYKDDETTAGLTGVFEKTTQQAIREPD